MTISSQDPYECPCGETFTKPETYAEHRAIYRWHTHIRARKDGTLVCTLCKKPFSNLDDFVNHWEREGWHRRQSFILSQVRPRKKSRIKVEMRPAERALLRDRIRQDKTKFRLKLGRRAEKLLLQEIRYSVKYLAMLTIVIVGVPHVGKSSVALSIGELIRSSFFKRLKKLFEVPEKMPIKIRRVIESQGKFEFYRPKVKYNFSVDTTTRQFGQSRLGDSIIQDEDPDLMGKRSGTIKQAISNLLNQMREAGITLIVCDPEMVGFVKMPNLIIEVVAKNEEFRICKCIVYDRKKVARGWLDIGVLDDDHPLSVKYFPDKTKNVTRKKRMRGFDSVDIDWEEFKEHCERAIRHVDHLYERGDIDPYRCPLRQLEVAILSAGIPADGYVQNGVLDTVKKYYRATKDEDSDLTVRVTEGLMFTPIRSINELEFLRKIADAWPNVLKQRKKRKEKPPPKFQGQLHAEAWYLKYKGKMKAKTIGRELAEFHPKNKPVSHGMINNDYDNGGYPAIFAHEVSGECGEYAVWQDFYKDHKWIGGHGKPDLMCEDHWVEVKVRCEGRKNLAKYIKPWEVEHIQKGGELTLVVVNYDFGKCVIEFYDVKLAEMGSDLDIDNTD